MTTVLVTGATGTIGSRVVERLRTGGGRVRALTRDPARSQALLDAGAEVVTGDFDDPASIRAAVEGVDAVFLACSNGPRQVEQECAVVDTAVAARVGRVVKLSAIGAQTGSPLAFWDAHARIEERLVRAGLSSVALQASFFMSNLLGQLDTISATGCFFLPAGHARVAMVDPRDVADATVVALLGGRGAAPAGDESYRLTGPESITFADAAGELAVALGRDVQYVDVPDDAARADLEQAGLPPFMVENLLALFGLLRVNAAAETTTDVADLTAHPARSLAAFLHDHLVPAR